MSRLRATGAILFIGLSVGLFSACSVPGVAPDRVDRFEADGRSCTGSWRLEPARDAPAEAQSIAESSLKSVVVTPEMSRDAKNPLASTDDVSADDLESEAYVLAVTLSVKDELEEAGYPDNERVIEIWSDTSCS